MIDLGLRMRIFDPMTDTPFKGSWSEKNSETKRTRSLPESEFKGEDPTFRDSFTLGCLPQPGREGWGTRKSNNESRRTAERRSSALLKLKDAGVFEIDELVERQVLEAVTARFVDELRRNTLNAGANAIFGT